MNKYTYNIQNFLIEVTFIVTSFFSIFIKNEEGEPYGYKSKFWTNRTRLERIC